MTATAHLTRMISGTLHSLLLVIGRAARGRAANIPAPWWAICRRALCGNVLLAGPFLTEQAADFYLAANRVKLGSFAKVVPFSGQCSPEYCTLLKAAQLVQQGQAK